MHHVFICTLDLSIFSLRYNVEWDMVWQSIIFISYFNMTSTLSIFCNLVSFLIMKNALDDCVLNAKQPLLMC